MLLDPVYAFLGNPASYGWLLGVVLVLVMLWDMRAYIIPNWASGVIILAYFPACYFMKLPLVEPLIAVAIMMGIGMLIYAARIMGGGDIKLLAALTIWTGLSQVSVVFLVYTAILGGILTIFLWFARVIIRIFWRKNLPVMLSRGAPVPYGLAIAGAFLIMMWQGKIPALTL